MLISAARLQKYWDLHPDVVVHIGAHEAEELDDYRRLGWGTRRTIWVEALPALAETVRQRVASLPHHDVVNAVLWDRSGEHISFQETNDSQASSALELKDVSDVYGDISVTRSWDFTTVAAAEALPFAELDRVGLVNLDIQGAELRALQGFGAELDRVDAVYSEVNLRELYRGVALFGELSTWLEGRGFTLVDEELLRGVGWGDALWIRSAKVPVDARARRRRRRAADLPQRMKTALWMRLRRRTS